MDALSYYPLLGFLSCWRTGREKQTILLSKNSHLSVACGLVAWLDVLISQPSTENARNSIRKMPREIPRCLCGSFLSFWNYSILELLFIVSKVGVHRDLERWEAGRKRQTGGLTWGYPSINCQLYSGIRREPMRTAERAGGLSVRSWSLGEHRQKKEAEQPKEDRLHRRRMINMEIC